jgi:toxin ParE1/3/4
VTQQGPWTVHLTAAAEADFRNILRWTAEQFGEAQARAYAETLSRALEALSEGPDAAGVRARDDIAGGLFMLHVARRGRRGRHFVIFRTGTDRATLRSRF